MWDSSSDSTKGGKGVIELLLLSEEGNEEPTERGALASLIQNCIKKKRNRSNL